MKKILLLGIAAFMLLPLFSQLQPLPLDAKVRKGTLPNGLTYYIRANSEPKGQAEFFIAQKVGSMQEEDNQRGLAHFLEHMAFNGTKNFPGKTLFTFTEGIGVKFGINLNAYTSWDETVYNLSSVPVTREGIIDSCLLILHDWANELTLNDKDINEERGVIREEMRTRNQANMRGFEKLLPIIYPNNKYGDRWVIGTSQVIENFTPQELRDYYERWYRPDHQGVIVVGDVDVEQVEAKIIKMFSDIPTPATPSERVPVTIEPNTLPIVTFITDPEMTETSIAIMFKHEPLPAEVKLSQQGLAFIYMQQMVGAMFNNRFYEIAQKNNAPFVGAYAYDGPFVVANTMDAFTVGAQAKEGGAKDAYQAVVSEIARVDQFGFTASEYDRARADFLSNMDKAYKERDKRKSVSIANECVRHFLKNESMPGIELEYAFYNQVAPMITVNEINALAKEFIKDENRVIYGFGPEKEGLVYPTNEELISIYTTEFTKEQTPYEEKVSNEPLIAKLPKAGKISKVTQDKTFGAQVYTLSNGITVVVKSTDFKDDEIQFRASSKGGTSLIEDADFVQIKRLSDVANVGGLGNFSKVDLSKALAGKNASVDAYVAEMGESIDGSCSPKDLETMMQLLYLQATSIREDEEAFSAYIARLTAQMEGLEANPMVAFSDSLQAGLRGTTPRGKRLQMSEIEKIDYKRSLDLFKQRFADMGDFTFVFVGNIDEKVFKPLVAQYIATLPSKKSKVKENFIPRGELLEGNRNIHFDKDVQVAKATVCAVYTGKMDYSPSNVIKLDVLSQILDIVYTEEIREKEGGTYGVAIQDQLAPYPYPNYSFLVYFDTDNKLREKLVSIVYREMEKLAQNGPRQTDFDKVKAYMLKDVQEKMRDNSTWKNSIVGNYVYNYGTGIVEKEALINSITMKDVQDLAAYIVAQNSRLELIMNGIAPVKEEVAPVEPAAPVVEEPVAPAPKKGKK